MLVHVGLVALESMDAMLFLVMLEASDNVYHEDSVAAVGDTAEVKLFSLEIINLSRLQSTRDIVEQKDSFLKEYIHLVISLLTSNTAWLFKDVKVDHLLPSAEIGLVAGNRARCDLLWQQVTIRCHEAIDVDFIALHIDATEHTVVGDCHFDHLILVIALVLFAKSDALWGKLSLCITIKLLLIHTSTVPATTTIEAVFTRLLVYSATKMHNVRSVKTRVRERAIYLQPISVPSTSDIKSQILMKCACSSG